MSKHKDKTPKNAKGEPIRGIFIVESGLPLYEDGKVNVAHHEGVKKMLAEHPTLHDDYHVLVMPVVGASNLGYYALNLSDASKAKLEELQQTIDEAMQNLATAHQDIIARILEEKAAKAAQEIADYTERVERRIDSMECLTEED